MKKAQVIEYYGTQRAAAKELDVDESLLSRWPEVVPLKWAVKFKYLSNGELDMRLKEDYVDT